MIVFGLILLICGLLFYLVLAGAVVLLEPIIAILLLVGLYKLVSKIFGKKG